MTIAVDNPKPELVGAHDPSTVCRDEWTQVDNRAIDCINEVMNLKVSEVENHHIPSIFVIPVNVIPSLPVQHCMSFADKEI